MRHVPSHLLRRPEFPSWLQDVLITKLAQSEPIALPDLAVLMDAFKKSGKRSELTVGKHGVLMNADPLFVDALLALWKAGQIEIYLTPVIPLRDFRRLMNHVRRKHVPAQFPRLAMVRRAMTRH